MSTVGILLSALYFRVDTLLIERWQGATAVGLYGVLTYVVTRRTHEIGVRMALGATRGEVVQYVLRQGARLSLVGAAVVVAKLPEGRIQVVGMHRSPHRCPGPFDLPANPLERARRIFPGSPALLYGMGVF